MLARIGERKAAILKPANPPSSSTVSTSLTNREKILKVVDSLQSGSGVVADTATVENLVDNRVMISKIRSDYLQG